MLSYPIRELFENTFTRLRWVSLVMLGSLFLEASVAEMMRWFFPFTGFNNPETGLSPNWQALILMVGLSDLVFLPFLRRRLLAIRPGAQPEELIRRMWGVSIISLAVSYTPAVLGLVIFLVWGTRGMFYALWGVSLLFLLVYFPRQSFWEEWVEGGGRMEG